MAVDERPITINSRKYDGSIRRSWQAGLVSERSDLIIAIGLFDADVEHSDLGLIRKGTVSFENFWRDRWYNVFRFHEPDGMLRNYYCNIAMPPVLLGDTLDYVDLDIDVVIWPDGRCEVLDRDDFEQNAVKFGYPQHVIAKAEESLAELLTTIEKNELP
jgi:protein associated with RNAse G/E